MKNHMIAEELFISAETVKSHKRNIISKLKLSSSIELYVYAIKFVKNTPKGY